MERIKYPRFGLPENKEIEDAYFRRLEESDGFDLSGVQIPAGAPLRRCCMEKANEVLVHLYARLGLHRYNLLLGENLELLDIKKLNQRNFYPSDYYITLGALDAATGIEKVFQVKVCEFAVRYLNVRCIIARPQDTNNISNETHPFLKKGVPDSGCLVDPVDQSNLPDWPASEDDFSDTTRFYVVKESEVEDHTWIRLYLELAVATDSRSKHPDTVSHLKIVKVVIETDQVVVEPLKNISATVYIRYKNTDRNKRGKGTNRIAIVRRFFNETTGHFVLLGKTCPVENTDDQRPQKRSKTVSERRLSTRTRKPIERFGC